MTTLTDALAKVPNPLAATIASDSDSTGLVDLPVLHAAARQILVQGCERARRGHSQVFALVGEEGLGKSHLMLWLRQRLTLRGDPLTYFISMPALPDLAQPFRHALRQLVGALCRRELTGAATDPADPSNLLDRPIDRLLWGALYTQTCDLLDAARVGMYQGPATLLKLLGPMCSDAGRRRPLPDFAAAAQKVWSQVEPGLRSYLLSLPTEMSIDSAARAVLLQFPYADRRALCTAWLAGEELSQKDRERLSAKQVINNENAAKYVLCSVVRLLTAPPGAQLILSYDQTQQLGEQLGQPGIQAMAEVVAAIHGCGGSSLQVLSLLPASFSQLYEKPTRTASTQGPPRHLDQTVRLEAVQPELLRELVAARLEVGLADLASRPSPLYPFTEAELDLSRWPQEANSPRNALLVFAERYSERRRELVPGSGGSGKNAVSTPDQRRPAAKRSKDAPSLTDLDRRPRSAQSPSMDFLSDEETSDAVAATPASPAAEQGVRPRSLTHGDESGATAASARTGGPRVGQSFVADSSPTLQAVPKSALAGAMVPTTVKAREMARDAKLAPSFAADSSPTQRAVTDDVMGKVRGPGAASKRSPVPGRELKQPLAPAAPSRAVSMSSEDVLMGRLGRPAKAADRASEPGVAPDKPGEKSADKSAARAAAPIPAKTADAEPALTKKTAVSAVPHVEADSSPTLKRGPDESLLKATRELSQPAQAQKPQEIPAKAAKAPSQPLKPAPEPSAANKVSPEPSRPLGNQSSRSTAPSSESGVIGRPTPTIAPLPALISASQPSRSPAKPVASAKPASSVSVAPATKPPAPEPAPPAISNVPDPLPPSAESPSMGWLAMANDKEQDPLASALKKLDTKEVAAPAGKAPAALSEPPRPAPTTPPARPHSPSAPPKSGPISTISRNAGAAAAAPSPRPATSPPAASKAGASMPPLAAKPAPAATAVAAARAKSDPIPAVAPMPDDNAPTELPPSAESPSMGWLAMASGSNNLDSAIAESGLARAAAPAKESAADATGAPAESAPSASDKSESGPAKARAARPVRGNMGMGVVVVNPTTVKPAEPVNPEPAPAENVRAPIRSTQARMPAIVLRTAQSVSPQQVLAALPESGMMEDWQLAQELGLPLDSLEKILVSLEEDERIRLMAMGDGQRMVVRID